MRRLMMLAMLAACGGDDRQYVPIDGATVPGEYDLEVIDCLEELNAGDCAALQPSGTIIIAADRPATNCRAGEWVVFQPETAFSMDGCATESGFLISTRNWMLGRRSFMGPMDLYHLGNGTFETDVELSLNGRGADMRLRLRRRE